MKLSKYDQFANEEFDWNSKKSIKIFGDNIESIKNSIEEKGYQCEYNNNFKSSGALPKYIINTKSIIAKKNNRFAFKLSFELLKVGSVKLLTSPTVGIRLYTDENKDGNDWLGSMHLENFMEWSSDNLFQILDHLGTKKDKDQRRINKMKNFEEDFTMEDLGDNLVDLKDILGNYKVYKGDYNFTGYQVKFENMEIATHASTSRKYIKNNSELLIAISDFVKRLNLLKIDVYYSMHGDQSTDIIFNVTPKK